MPSVPEPIAASGQQVLKVGSGQQFATLASAAAALNANPSSYNPGDIVEILSNLDNDSATFLKDVRIWCAPGVKLTWSAGTSKRMAWGKGFLVFDGAASNVEVDNCETSGATTVPADDGGDPKSMNAAGSRVASAVNNAVFKNVNFHDGNNGILSDGGNANVSISDSKFYNNGISGDGHTHNIYIGNSPSVTVSNSYFGPVHQGNIFKSRAAKTTIDGSTFDSQGQDGGSWTIDAPNCGQVAITNSVLEKSALAGQRSFLSFGVEGCSYSANSYSISNSIMIADTSGSNFMVLGGGMSTSNVTVANMTMVGPIGGVQAGQNILTYNARSDASMPAAPALPPPP